MNETVHGASEKPGRGGPAIMDLATSQRMLPLVARIVRDIVGDHRELERLLPEQERLDRQKRDLDWNDRFRRYAIQAEIQGCQNHLEETTAELGRLGVVLEDEVQGQVGFPTVVNGRTAYFSWRMGEQTIEYWHFSKENVRRAMPANWSQSAKN
jgi:hypothetical protein